MRKTGRPLLVISPPRIRPAVSVAECMMPLSTVPEDRLSALMGMELKEGDVEWVNTVPGTGGDVIPDAMARDSAEWLSPLLRGRRTLLLGVVTAWAFRRLQPPLVWQEEGEGAVAWIPEIGGPWWEDSRNLFKGQMFLWDIGREMIKGEL